MTRSALHGVVVVVVVLLGAVLAGCSKASDADLAEPAATTDGGSVFAPTGADSDASARASCATDDTKDVYVVTEQKKLYRFHPPTLAFTEVGNVACPAGGATPTSMAVDRQGIAWVRHSDGSIWKVDTQSLFCTRTDFLPPDSAFFKFGMGFASETSGSQNEALFLSDSEGAGLAKLDTAKLVVTPVGPYTSGLEGRAAELTGTGDGKLYGFFVTVPVQIAEISKGTGAVIATNELAGVAAGDAWAFSFYGGDFYVYTHNPAGPLPADDHGSTVTRFRPSDRTVEVVKKDLGFKIVGAGVSTCAPTSLPK